jgi:hypothetical protein
VIAKVKINFDMQITYFFRVIERSIKLSIVRLTLLSLSLFSLSFSLLSQAKEINLNDVQMIGSHNSYKKPLNPQMKILIAEQDAKKAAQINYSHPDLIKQLALGLRHFEIDIVKDPEGGKFAYPEGEKLTQQTILTSAERAKLNLPGFKVIHIPDLDFKSHCVLFQKCLDELLQFSKEQPNHLPIVILMNLKESSTKIANATPVLSFDTEDYDELDKVLLTTFGDKLITPNEIKGQYSSLEQAVLTKGWPSINEARGHFLFILDGKPHQLEKYRKGHQSLKDRALFGSYPAGEPEAALMIRNNPAKSFEEIKQLVAKGYLVRTRADSGAGSMSKMTDVKLQTERAFYSGAQIISTDFYPGAPQVLSYDFFVGFNQGKLYRCNHKVRKEKCELGD